MDKSNKIIVTFMIEPGVNRTYILMRMDQDVKAAEVFDELIKGAPERNKQRRQWAQNVYEKKLEIYPRELAEWEAEEATCRQYEEDMEHYRRALEVWGENPDPSEKPEEPKKPSCWPHGPQPNEPEAPEPNEFDGSLLACLDEIQSMDLEEAGLKVVQIVDNAEIYHIETEWENDDQG